MAKTLSNIQSPLLNLDVGINTNIQLWQQNLLDGINSVNIIPNDYNPPKYPTGNTSQTEVNAQAKDSSVRSYLLIHIELFDADCLNCLQSFLNSIETAIYNTSTTSSIKVTSPSVSLNSTMDSLPTIFLSKFKTAWASFESRGINFSFLWVVFGSVNGLFYLLDYIYRGVQTAKLVAQFWSRSIVHLPKIHLSQNQKTDSRNLNWLTSVSWFLKLLPFMWFQLCVLVGIVILVIWLIARKLLKLFIAHSCCSNFFCLYCRDYDSRI